MLPNLSRKSAIVIGADESGGDQMAHCEIEKGGKDLLIGSCRFRQFGGNGSFSVYPKSRDERFEGDLTSLTLTVTSPGVGDLKGLVRDGTAENWGTASLDSLQQACWKGNSFRLCIYAETGEQ